MENINRKIFNAIRILNDPNQMDSKISYHIFGDKPLYHHEFWMVWDNWVEPIGQKISTDIHHRLISLIDIHPNGEHKIFY